MPLGPFDLPGPQFLTLYGVLLVVTIVCGFIIPRWLRPEGRAQRVTDTDMLAYLAGGANRFAEAVVVRLMAVRLLVMVDRSQFHVQSRGGGRNAAERSVLAMPGTPSWSMIASAVKPHADPIRNRLVASGLMIDDGTAWRMRLWQSMPYALLIGFGLIKVEIGMARDRPVGFLVVLLIVTGICALIRFAALDRKTRAGVAALDDAMEASSRLRGAPTTDESALAVALFGTTVLIGSGLAGFHTMRQSSSSGGDSGGGDSGGGDGGGCGGGGCGGCGG